MGRSPGARAGLLVELRRPSIAAHPERLRAAPGRKPALEGGGVARESGEAPCGEWHPRRS